MKRLVVDSSRCTGCRSCVLACSFQHARVFCYDKSRITLARDPEHGRATPRVCIGCEAAYCVASCPVGALARDVSSGTIRVDSTICVGCRRCLDACPHGGIGFDEDLGIPLICDTCGGDPACVKFCAFPQAIRYVAMDKETIQ